MVTVAIHQPNYLPYLGFFHKLARADVLVLYDTAQFSKNEFHNRSQIKIPRGRLWLTVPVRRHPLASIRDIEIAPNQKWAERHARTLKANYARTPYYETYKDGLNRILARSWTHLADLNESAIRTIARWLRVDTRIVRASDLEPSVSVDPTEKIVHLTRQCGGTTYLSGIRGRDYLRPEAFGDIRLSYDEFVARPYSQLFGKFIPNLSAVDALFNLGENAQTLLA